MPETGDCVPIKDLDDWIGERIMILSAEKITVGELASSDLPRERAMARLEGLKFDGQALELKALAAFVDRYKQ